jgi:radical SAM superfamily enzyme YgiQ (UPF0313 family)
MYSPIQYNEPLFRPPAEANSLIFQVTLGCSWNSCAFCNMYASKQFKVRPEEEVLNEIKTLARLFPNTRKVFLADGNAMVLSTAKLLRILHALSEHFPKLHRVSAYALPKDIISKTHDELVVLKNAGLKLVYVGIESGDDEILRMVNKGETYNSIVDGLLQAKKAGIKSSVMILSGLGGAKYSKQHAIASANVVNATQPEFTSLLVLSFPYGEHAYKERFQGDYVPMSVHDLLVELEEFVAHTQLENSIFRTTHASNYLALQGILGRDKDKLLSQLSIAIHRPDMAHLRHEWERGL